MLVLSCGIEVLFWEIENVDFFQRSMMRGNGFRRKRTHTHTRSNSIVRLSNHCRAGDAELLNNVFYLDSGTLSFVRWNLQDMRLNIKTVEFWWCIWFWRFFFGSLMIHLASLSFYFERKFSISIVDDKICSCAVMLKMRLIFKMHINMRSFYWTFKVAVARLSTKEILKWKIQPILVF